MISSQKDNCHVPLIDARRGYVFAAIYNDNYQQILKPQHIKLEDLMQKLEEVKDYTFITNDDIEVGENKEAYHPDIAKIVNFFANKETINPHAVNPEYLKLTEAEEKIQ